MDSTYRSFKERIQEFHELSVAADILEWDQQVCMPRGGAQARMEQYGTLRKLAHEKFVADDMGTWIEELSRGAQSRDHDSLEASLIRWAAREYDRKRRLPASLVEALARQASLAQEVWVEARSKGDFKLFEPALGKMVELKCRQAEAFGDCADPYDAWLDEFEPGVKTEDLNRLFEELKAGLLPLVQAVSSQKDRIDDSPLHQQFDVAAQRAFGEEVARAIGFDFDRGRQDVSAHPFSVSFSPGDARITTRFDPEYIGTALFGTIHEAGHAMYEQGVSPDLGRTPLCAGASMGMHESQSRLWENVVGRSRGFWKHFYPRLQQLFPQLASTDLERFYRAINKAAPSFIRVEADELTYNLHILLRFELEQDLVRGRLRVEELPQAWNAKMKSYLGITPADARQGVLQDVHWSAGLFGYFPTYALGNIISLQLYETALKAAPAMRSRIEEGEFSSLLGWLREHIHRHGRKFTAPELVERATGRPIDAGAYLRYLNGKYGELYGLEPAVASAGAARSARAKS